MNKIKENINFIDDWILSQDRVQIYFCNGKPFTGISKDNQDNIFYHENGLLHRVDGPAAIFKTEDNYFLYGRLIGKSKNDFELFLKKQKMKIFE